ncbi:unnamed protein product [Linum trigynum]|uniref:Uncharacterized protein n=1 Tax=Linum trigynum TaxID=586398 RepID=A0AAV2G7K0_9ROSI
MVGGEFTVEELLTSVPIACLLSSSKASSSGGRLFFIGVRHQNQKNPDLVLFSRSSLLRFRVTLGRLRTSPGRDRGGLLGFVAVDDGGWAMVGFWREDGERRGCVAAEGAGWRRR